MSELHTDLDLVEEIGNPLDCIEDVLSANAWSFHRLAEDALSLTIKGDAGLYSLFFTWHPDEGALQFVCDFDLAIPADRFTQLFSLLNEANRGLWMGHFELPEGSLSPRYRTTALFRDQTYRSAMDQMKDLMDWGLQTCERVAPAFRLLSESNSATSSESLSLAFVAPSGSA